MKKSLIIISLVVLALGVLGIGVALAQESEPPTRPFGHMRGLRGGFAEFHTYKLEAFADALGLEVDDVNAMLESGTHLYQIALDQGIAEEDLPALMLEVHENALDAAVADEVLSQEQADLMLERMQYRFENGFGPGFGPCHGAGDREKPSGQFGPSGGMMRGFGRGLNSQQTP